MAASLDSIRIKSELHEIVKEWRGLLRKHIQPARQILRKLLDGPTCLYRSQRLAVFVANRHAKCPPA
jgi:hypothetical protein